MRVLLVEDNALVCDILAEELRDAGFLVSKAASADEAADLMSGQPTPPTILVTDIHMPGRLDGLALVRLLRSRFPELPVVYITGRPDVMDRLGRNEVLVRKPFTPSEVFAAIRQLLPEAIKLSRASLGQAPIHRSPAS